MIAISKRSGREMGDGIVKGSRVGIRTRDSKKNLIAQRRCISAHCPQGYRCRYFSPKLSNRIFCVRPKLQLKVQLVCSYSVPLIVSQKDA